ncbi:MAG: HlyD family efflux transporter periplasmic adaptor subunit [Pseudomonadota bacterium]
MTDTITPVKTFANPNHVASLVDAHKTPLPSALSAVALAVVLFIAATVAILWHVPWIQTAEGIGQVTTLDPGDRLHEINALVGGRIKEWYVRDGSFVNAGDPILEIADIDPRFVERLNADLDARRSRLRAARNAASTAKIDYQRQRQLHEQGLSARKDFELAEIKYQELLAKVAEIQATINQAEIDISRQSSQIVRAAQDGRIVHIEAGNTATLIKAGSPIATFAPSHFERAVEVFVSGLDAPLIAPGLEARVMFEGWPAVQFSGWPETAIGTFGAIVIVVDPVATRNNEFRVLLVEDPEDPWPADRYLRLGSQSQAWIQLGEVRLGYELWRQLNRFPPLPPSAPNGASP